jgi:hypothetical protein
VLTIALAGAASTAAADHPPAPVTKVPPVDQKTWEASQTREFGATTINIMQIPAAAFRSEYSAGKFSWADFGYFGPDSDSGSGYLWAPVTIPTGVKLLYMNGYYQDTNASADVAFYLYRTTGGAGISPGLELLASSSSSAAPGYGFASAAVSPDYLGAPSGYTVDNYANGATDPTPDLKGGQYFIEVYFGDVTGGLAIRGVELVWQRQISPAPGTATFSDVPVTHTFFQSVEALRASGITTGCGGTNYCPDATVTRGQMAAFLARALGLHWDH